jgi:hypothetical protein
MSIDNQDPANTPLPDRDITLESKAKTMPGEREMNQPEQAPSFLQPLIDEFGFPTPQEVAAALRSGRFDHRELMSFDPAEMMPRANGPHSDCNYVPTPLALYANHFRVSCRKEFSLLAHCYGTAMTHGWAWRAATPGGTSQVPDGKGLLTLALRHPVRTTVMGFATNAILFALETKRHGETASGDVDHDVTFCGPLAVFVDRFKQRFHWNARKLTDLASMYVTGFRHGWALHEMETKK